MKKKLFLPILLLLTFLSTTAFAEDFEPIGLYIHGQSDPNGMIVKSHTMVALKELADTLGLEVNQNNLKKEISISKKGYPDLTLTLDSELTKINNPSAYHTFFVKENNTFVPLRLVSEHFGETVTWYPKTKVVSVGSFPKQDTQQEHGELMYFDYLEGSLRFPANWREEVEIKIIEKGNHSGLYIIDKESKKQMDLEYPQGLNGVLYRFVTVESPWAPVETSILLREQNGNHLMVLPDTDFNFTKDSAKHYNILREKYQKVIGTYSFEGKKTK